MPADWQLPPGVSRGMWEYFHDPAIARNYDDRLKDTPLLSYDLDFFFRHSPALPRAVDLGCGTGRLAIALAKKNAHVLALDLSKEMLQIVKEKSLFEKVHVDRIQANVVDLSFLDDQIFDVAGCLFGTIGMIQGEKNRRKMLHHVHRILKPGGIFVFHVHNPWFHLWTKGGRRLLRKNIWNAGLGREAFGDFWMPPDQGIGGFTMHLFSRNEIDQLLRQIGFQILEIKPISLNADGNLPMPWFLSRLRSYGFLAAARK